MTNLELILTVLVGVAWIGYLLEKKENRFLRKNVAQYLFFVETCARFKCGDKWNAHKSFIKYIGIEPKSGNLG